MDSSSNNNNNKRHKKGYSQIKRKHGILEVGELDTQQKDNGGIELNGFWRFYYIH